MPSISDIANRLSALENGWTWLEACTFNAAVTTKGATSLATTAQMTAGSGTAGTGTVIKYSVVKIGSIFETTVLVDVTGLNSNSAGDIIGVNGGTANCHIGQITAAVNGTIFGGYMLCVETPATGEPDIDLYSATESTGAEDAAISGLAETQLVNANADWTDILGPKGLSAVPAANEYLYLVGSGGGTDATYTAGKFIIKLYGY